MTRLTEALKRAAETTATPVVATAEPLPTTGEWKFAPVETMYVPEARTTETELPDAVVPDAPAAPPITPVAPTDVPVPVGLQFGADDRDKLVVSPSVDRSVVEQYRHLAATFHQAQKSSGVRTVTVTSALPSEGKTLTATNLALTLSESYQRRVLLIDADLRRPRMREMFGLPMSEGLADALTSARGTRLPVHHVTRNLWVLAAGTMVPDPMNLLVSPAMKQLIDDARESFDWVIVDTPPVAILPDAHLLSAMIDTALLVVSAQSTPYPIAQRAVEAIGAKKILGVVLNRAEQIGPTAGYSYGYGYRSGSPEPKGRRWLGWLRKRREKSHVQ
ncbi:MAG: polysaccharide biosynthesis tyrosine autokinase [Acidobacteriota bacterium]